MINIKNIDLNKIKIDKKSKKNMLIYHTGYRTIKNLCYVKINSINPLYLIINKTNEKIEESNGNRYLRLDPFDGSNNILKKYEEVWSKIGGCIRSENNNSNNCNKKYMKIKFNSDDDLSPTKTLQLHHKGIVAIFGFQENNKHCPQVF